MVSYKIDAGVSITMSIKSIFKKTAAILFAAAVLFTAAPVTAFAAPDIDIIYAADADANAGDTVNVMVSTKGGTSISTLGLRLYYDKEKLAYQGSQWAEGLQNSGSSMTLVSDVVYNGSQVLNISMIADGGYQSTSSLVTLVFTVKESYTENPFRLELREITDENLQSVESVTSIVYQNTGSGSGGGTGSSGEETNPPGSGTGSSDENINSPGNETNETTSEPAANVPAASSTAAVITADATDSTAVITSVDAANSTTPADIENTTSTTDTASTSVSADHPKTFQTGIDDFGTNLLVIGAAFGMAGIACIMIRRKLS